MDWLFWLLDDMFFAAIPAVGFALLFNVPAKALKYCAMLGALGHVTRTLLLHWDMPIIFATLVGAALIGFIGVHLSHRYLAPESLHRGCNYSDESRRACLQGYDRYCTDSPLRFF